MYILTETLSKLTNVLENPDADPNVKIKVTELIGNIMTNNYSDLNHENECIEYINYLNETLKKSTEELEIIKQELKEDYDYSVVEDQSVEFDNNKDSDFKKQEYMNKLHEIQNIKDSIADFKYPKSVENENNQLNYITTSIDNLFSTIDEKHRYLEEYILNITNRISQLEQTVISENVESHEYIKTQLDNLNSNFDNNIKNITIRIDDLESGLSTHTIDTQSKINVIKTDIKSIPPSIESVNQGNLQYSPIGSKIEKPIDKKLISPADIIGKTTDTKNKINDILHIFN